MDGFYQRWRDINRFMGWSSPKTGADFRFGHVFLNPQIARHIHTGSIDYREMGPAWTATPDSDLWPPTATPRRAQVFCFPHLLIGWNIVSSPWDLRLTFFDFLYPIACTLRQSQVAIGNPMYMKFLMGQSSINVEFSIATFDYRRVNIIYPLKIH